MARITVVNDNADFLGLMADLLATEGHVPTAVRSEDLTIEAIADTEPELLIVDLRLDDAAVLADGWAVVVGARAHPALADVPIVLCSADVLSLRERSAEIAALADVHPLAKPFSLADVEALLDQILSRKAV